MQDVAGGETEHAITRVDEPVLTPVVVREAVAMAAGTVVFDEQARVEITEIGPGQERAIRIVQRPLYIGPRQTFRHQEDAEASLHRALAAGVGHLHCADKPRDSPVTRMIVLPRAQLLESQQTGPKCHVEQHHTVDNGFPSAEVGHRADQRRRRQSPDVGYLGGEVVRPR